MLGGRIGHSNDQMEEAGTRLRSVIPGILGLHRLIRLRPLRNAGLGRQEIHRQVLHQRRDLVRYQLRRRFLWRPKRSEPPLKEAKSNESRWPYRPTPAGAADVSTRNGSLTLMAAKWRSWTTDATNLDGHSLQSLFVRSTTRSLLSLDSVATTGLKICLRVQRSEPEPVGMRLDCEGAGKPGQDLASLGKTRHLGVHLQRLNHD